MSELTRCCYCVLRDIRSRAKENDSRVILQPEDGGTSVYVVPKGHVLDTRREPGTGNHLGGQFRAWLMEISDHCVC